MSSALSTQNVWVDKIAYSDAEKKYYEEASKDDTCFITDNKTNKVDEVPAKKKNKKSRKEKESAEPAEHQQSTTECPHLSAKAKKEKSSKNREEVSECPVLAQAAEDASGKKKKHLKIRFSDDSLIENADAAPVNTKKSKSQRRKEKKAQEEDTSEEVESISEGSKAAGQKDKQTSTASASTTKGRNSVVEKKQVKESVEGGGTQKGQKDEEKGGRNGLSLVSEIAKARQHIKKSLERMDGIAALASTPGTELFDRLSSVETENEKLRSVIDKMEKLVLSLQDRVSALEKGQPKASVPPPAAAAAKVAADDDDDGVDLFASESEDDEAADKIKEARLAEYAAKKAKKPALIAKSNIIFDIKPWDDETDMKAMETQVRQITMEGLLWGASKLVPLAYGIHKLQISCVVEDEKVSIDLLQEEIEKNEDLVQSVDIAAFNKI
ncbi:Probable elongation factor 1-delta [Sergentomyia squamirostris]